MTFKNHLDLEISTVVYTTMSLEKLADLSLPKLRRRTYNKVIPRALVSRGICGLRGKLFSRLKTHKLAKIDVIISSRLAACILYLSMRIILKIKM